MRQERDLRISRVWLDEHGLVHLRYKPGVVFEIDDARELIATCWELTGEEPAYLVSDLELKGATSEARAFAASPEYTSKLAAVASFGKSGVGRLIVTVFLRLQRPAYPLRVFATEAEAVAWLLKIRGNIAAA